MKRKILTVLMSCVLIIATISSFAACGDDTVKPENQPIIGTWLCESAEDSAVYYVTITARENDDYHLNWEMYGAFVYKVYPEKSNWREYRVTDLGINPKVSGRYSLQTAFSNGSNALYRIDLTDSNAFEVTGDQFSVSEEKYEFRRTELTLEQFKEQYWDRLVSDK